MPELPFSPARCTVYSHDELLALCDYDVTPARSVRKAIFNYRLWLPGYLRAQQMLWGRVYLHHVLERCVYSVPCIGERLGADVPSTSLLRGRLKYANGESRVISDYNPSSLLTDYVVIFADMILALHLYVVTVKIWLDHGHTL